MRITNQYDKEIEDSEIDEYDKTNFSSKPESLFPFMAVSIQGTNSVIVKH
jgi:hypothetical protein